MLKTQSRKDFVARARDLIAGKQGVTRTLEPLLEILATMLGEFAKPAKRAFAIVQNKPVCRPMMSASHGPDVPGEALIWG